MTRYGHPASSKRQVVSMWRKPLEANVMRGYVRFAVTATCQVNGSEAPGSCRSGSQSPLKMVFPRADCALAHTECSSGAGLSGPWRRHNASASACRFLSCLACAAAAFHTSTTWHTLMHRESHLTQAASPHAMMSQRAVQATLSRGSVTKGQSCAPCCTVTVLSK